MCSIATNKTSIGLSNIITNLLQNEPLSEKDIRLINFKKLSNNYYVTAQIIEKYINQNWNFETLSETLYYLDDYVYLAQKYPLKSWNYKYIEKNFKFTREFYQEIFKNIKLTKNILESNLVKNLISEKNRLTYFTKLLSTEEKIILLDNIVIDFNQISISENLDIVEHFKDRNWNFKKLSKSKGLSYNLYKQLADKDWDIDYIEKQLELFNQLKILEHDKTMPWHSLYSFKYSSIFNNMDAEDNMLINSINYKYLSSIRNKKVVAFFQKFYDRPWDYHQVSCNEFIPFDFIIKIKKNKLNFNYRQLSKRRDLTFKIIKKLGTKDWDWDIILERFDNIKFIKKYYKFGWEVLRRICRKKPEIVIKYLPNHIDLYKLISKEFSIKLVLKHPEIEWDLTYLIHWNKFNLDLFLRYPNECWNWPQLTLEKQITKDIIVKFKDKPWNTDYIICSDGWLKRDGIGEKRNRIPFDFNWITLLPNKKFNFGLITHNCIFTFDDILRFKNELWDFKFLSKEYNFDYYLFFELPNVEWDFCELSRHISFDIIKKYDYKWNYSILSKRSDLNLEFVKNNFDKFADYYRDLYILTSHPIMTINFIKENLSSQWNYYEITRKWLNELDENLISFSTDWDYKTIFNSDNKRIIELFINKDNTPDFKILNHIKDLTANKIVDEEFFKKYIDVILWDIDELMKKFGQDIVFESYGCSSILEKIVLKYKLFENEKLYKTLFKNPNISRKFYYKFLKKRCGEFYYKDVLYTYNPNLTLDDLHHHYNDSDSDEEDHIVSKSISLASNKNLTFDYVFNYVSFEEWNYNLLQENIIISSDVIEKYPEFNWSGNLLVKNPNFNDMIFIEHKYLFSEKNIRYLAKNYKCHNLVKLYPDEDWYGNIMENKYYRLKNTIIESTKENILSALEMPKIYLYSEQDELSMKEFKSKWGNNIIKGNVLKKILGNELITFEIIDSIFQQGNINYTLILKNNFGLRLENDYWSGRKENSIYYNNIIRDELLGIAWNPDRFKDWCLSTEEKKELEKRW